MYGCLPYMAVLVHSNAVLLPWAALARGGGGWSGGGEGGQISLFARSHLDCSHRDRARLCEM